MDSDEQRRSICLRFLAQPTDANFGGKVHGGTAMQWLDQAGYTCATGWSGHYCVTAFVGDINFHAPVPVGNLVEVRARIIHTGRTSMHISLELHSSNPRSYTWSRAIHAFMSFVAVDETGRPVSVPHWEPRNVDDHRLHAYAMRIADLRKINKDKLEGLL